MKKLLVISTVAALGLSGVALAGGLPETMPIAPVSACDTGLYLGLQGGYGMTNWKNLTDAHSTKNNAFVGRAFVGADLNRFFAVEFGYTMFFNKPQLQGSDSITTKRKNTMVFDLMGKIKAPVVEGLDLYAKVGMNYMLSRSDGKISTITYASKKNLNSFNVAFGAGADYYITSNIVANVEWLRFNGSAKLNDKYHPHVDAFLLGLRYKFDI